jgi:uncharacterized protein (DUF1015 family)
MAIIKPFHGIRYQKKNISSVVCPPYDIISPEEKERLKKRSEHNIVKIELPDAAGTRNKYQQAQKLFSAWQAEQILRSDADPCFYFYEQTFSDRGVTKTRRGFFAALMLEDSRKGDVKPHEKTLAKPKEDRLKLFKAVKANISPIFGVFDDKKGSVALCAKALAKTEPNEEARDDEGTKHRLWRICDPADIKHLEQALASKSVFIADGHHRYETGWNYLQEMKKKDKKYSTASAYNYIMIYLCPINDKGLSIWPTHRVVEAPHDLEQRITEYFNVLPQDQFSRRSSSSPQPLLVSFNGKKRTLVVKNKSILAKHMPDKCAAYRELGVSILHSLLLPEVPADKITYVKDEKKAYQLAAERGQCAVIVPATPVEAVKKIALAGQTMPQKSTYFYPKVATGMVFHSLK